MQLILIRVQTEKLINPDIDLRYLISDRIEEVSDGKIMDAGYDYDDDDVMGIFLETEDVNSGINIITELFEEETLLGNDLTKSVIIYTSDDDIHYKAVYPVGFEEEIELD